MTDPLAHEVQPLLLDLHKLLRTIDRRGRRGWERTQPRLADFEARLAGPLSRATGHELEPGLSELSGILAERPANPETRAAWKVYLERLQKAYDSLGAQVRGLGLEVPLHRPDNFARSAMHVTTALVCLLLVEYVLTERGMIIVAGVGALACWALETGRIFSDRLNRFLLRSMAAVAHPHERRHVNSATWYTTALLVLAVLFIPKVCVVALAIMGLADPAAAFVGRRWGRIRLVNGRSLEGTATFFVVGTLAALATLSIWHPEVRLGVALLMALGAAFAGALTELFSKRVDDNLSIPIAAAVGAWAVAAAL
ncbi:MAG: diacylglycerol/polyprenol kinase family protein [Planctomycetota bacterium]